MDLRLYSWMRYSFGRRKFFSVPFVYSELAFLPDIPVDPFVISYFSAEVVCVLHINHNGVSRRRGIPL